MAASTSDPPPPQNTRALKNPLPPPPPPQAESVLQLLQARTPAAADSALAGLSGGVSVLVGRVRAACLALLAELEVGGGMGGWFAALAIT